MKVLVIQTAFIGDVVLATGLLESIHQYDKNARIDFLVRKGNEGLLDGHPFLNKVLIWDKKKSKYKSLRRLIREIRSNRYDKVINLQRFGSTGWLTARSGARETFGFEKNPFSSFFTHKARHEVGNKTKLGKHEVERNLALVKNWGDLPFQRPKLYPGSDQHEKVKNFTQAPFVTMSPASVWFTKQLPPEQWSKLIAALGDYNIYLLGGPGDAPMCEKLKGSTPNVEVLAGKLSFLESAALMEKAKMNYVNDSAPLHFASAVNAPVTAFFCSTIPEFGFTPLSDENYIGETEKNLSCRPCGLHGLKSCPKGHFDCALSIDVLKFLPKNTDE